MLIQPSVDLYDRIINRINKEEKLAVLKRRLILQSSGLLLSFSIFFPLAIKLYFDIVKSGIVQFFSLIFTDFTIVASNIGDYLLTLLESTPTFSLALASAATLAVVFYIAKLEDGYADFKKLLAANVKN